MRHVGLGLIVQRFDVAAVSCRCYRNRMAPVSSRERNVPLGGPASVVETACPLDCPDACSLAVTVQHGKVVDDRRLAQEPGHRRLHLREGPEVRRARLRPGSAALSGGPQGPQGRGPVRARDVGRSARARSPSGCERAKARIGRRVDSALLVRRLERPADAGQPRRAAVAALRHVAAGAHALRGADRRGQHGALRQDAVGHLSGLSGGRADHPVGRQSVGVGHSPRPVRARGAEARREARRHRSADRRRWRERPTCTWRSSRAPTSPSRWRSTAICSTNGLADEAFLREHTRGADRLRERAERVDDRAGRRASPASIRPRSSGSPSCTRSSSPALIRCGWGLERNRNGGNAAMAVLALPAVGGKFGVRGGGYSMSNSASWNIERPWIGAHEPDTRVVNMNHLGRALTEYDDPPVNVLFVYNCNPAATVPDQHRVLRGPRARGSLHGRLRAGDDRHGALRRRHPAGDDVPRGLRLREGVRADQHRARPARSIDAVGEARSNADVFGELCARLGLLDDDEPTGELDLLRAACSTRCPARSATTCARARARRRRSAPRRSSSWTCFPNTPDRKVDLFPAALEASAPAGLYRYPAGSGDRALSADAHLAGERADDQLDARRAAAARRQADDASRTMRRRAGWRTAIWCGSSTISARCTAR